MQKTITNAGNAILHAIKLEITQSLLSHCGHTYALYSSRVVLK